MSIETKKWEPGNLITGGKIRKTVVEELSERYKGAITANRESKQKCKVAILRFEKPNLVHPLGDEDKRILNAYEAAKDSMNVKQKTFAELGYEVIGKEVLPRNMQPKEFDKIIKRLNEDQSVSAIIVQNPVPDRMRRIVKSISPQKDIDALSLKPGIFRIPATSATICKIFEPFIEASDEQLLVAVVGARGFVGREVINRLKELNVEYIPIDKTDPDFNENLLIEKVKAADIVISTVGSPGLLDERHLSPHHRLVVDCGYVPQDDGSKLGDVAVSARSIPQNITKVPNGTGPMEMAELAERIIQKDIDPGLERWQLQTYYEIRSFNRSEVQEMQRTDQSITGGSTAPEMYQPSRGELMRWYGSARAAGDSSLQQIALDAGQRLAAEFKATGGGEVAPRDYSSPNVVVSADVREQMERVVKEQEITVIPRFEVEITIEPEQTKGNDRGR
jgi:methylenetetrahydrofolate dehydrogenase (NADP+) / methenyltetrahydrofolate cyclohydrolase